MVVITLLFEIDATTTHEPRSISLDGLAEQSSDPCDKRIQVLEQHVAKLEAELADCKNRFANHRCPQPSPLARARLRLLEPETRRRLDALDAIHNGLNT